MPKVKTRKIVTKRFKLSKGGKLMRRKQNRRHLIKAKSKSQKRRLNRNYPVSKKLAKKIRTMLK